MFEDFPIIIIHGNYELYIENFEKINDFSDINMQIKSHKYKINISGKNLSIEYLNSDDIKVKGIITQLNICEVEN